jgi:4'-phosphopantetheinyl transferase
MIHWALRTRSEDPAAGGLEDEPLTAAERSRLGGLRTAKRRGDWLLGRLTAKRVVAEALRDVVPGEWPLRAIEIASDGRGAPWARLAPEARPIAGFAPGERLPVSVSISHAEGHALCAATALERDGARPQLGIDLGRIEPRSRELVDTFFTDDERRLVGDAPPGERALDANLVWCAKEAVLKALGLGLTVDTRDLSCLPAPGLADRSEWRVAPRGDEWRPFVAACGPRVVPGGATIHGIWRTFPGFVAALATHRAHPCASR